MVIAYDFTSLQDNDTAAVTAASAFIVVLLATAASPSKKEPLTWRRGHVAIQSGAPFPRGRLDQVGVQVPHAGARGPAALSAGAIVAAPASAAFVHVTAASATGHFATMS